MNKVLYTKLRHNRFGDIDVVNYVRIKQETEHPYPRSP